jgi:AbrB family looped-hinge helix DNA binding protein
MKTVAVAFAGSAGSGKSTIACRVASLLRWRRTGFGDYLRTVAAKQRLAGSREELQELGAQIIDRRGARGFCEDVISASGWTPGSSLIIDGLRHPEIHTALEEILAPTPVVVIFVNADDQTRTLRLRERGEVHPDGVRNIDLHRVEQHIGELPMLASLRVDGTKREEFIVDEVVDYLIEFCELPPLHSTVTDGYQVRIPKAIRHKLNLQPGDTLDFDEAAEHLSAHRIADTKEERIRSVVGALKSDLKNINVDQWLNELRGRVELPKE